MEVRALYLLVEVKCRVPHAELAMVLMLGARRMRSNTGFVGTVSSLVTLPRGQ